MFEGFLEVLGRLWLTAPATFPELMAGLDQQQQAAVAAAAANEVGGGAAAGGGGATAVDRLLDRWLTIASARFLEEVIGEQPGPSCVSAIARYHASCSVERASPFQMNDHTVWPFF